MKQLVSAIVCAYNEEKTVKPILEVLLSHPRIDEVIAVDDGSTDRTWKIINEIHHSSLIPIRHSKNHGKGAAVATGVKQANGNFVLLSDADIKNFLHSHIDLLLLPLDIDPEGMTVGTYDFSRVLDKTIFAIMKSFGGQRATRRSYILPLIDKIRKSGYGVEMILNLDTIRRKRKIYYVPLPKLHVPLKTDKRTISEVLKEYWREQNDIIRQLLGLDTIPSLQDILNKLQLR